MTKKLYNLEVRGRAKVWDFPVMAEPGDVEDWLADGLDVTEVNEEEEITEEEYRRIMRQWSA